MLKRKKESKASGKDANASAGFPLDWPTSQRWNPRYDVPRNSVEGASRAGSDPLADDGTEPDSDAQHHHVPRSMSYGRTTRDLDTYFDAARQWRADEEEDEVEHEFSSMTHWLDALSEIYMNNLDNRSRWEPRWLNITSRERFEGLSSVRMEVLDYHENEERPRCTSVNNKQDLAIAVQERPVSAQMRVYMVSDVSRFIMGVLGHLCAVDPEFWFEHLVQSGYCASDSGLKLKNAAWLNWVEREKHFRHHALPGPGQRTEWNVRRRVMKRTWTHLRWGRLGLLNYLGRKGFHEDEIQYRLSDGRWLIEQDVTLTKHGLLMTQKRKARAEKRARQEAKKNKKQSAKAKETPSSSAQAAASGHSARYKAANVYRPYSTFDPLPRNPSGWDNRDLRVMAPEGLSYWAGSDNEGRKTIIILVDPVRKMKNAKTGELTPSLTFMPRALEWEAYDEDRRWQFPEPSETFLDPPPPPMSKAEIKKRKKEATKQKLKEGNQKFWKRFRRDDAERGSGVGEKVGKASPSDEDTGSSIASDSEYSDEYETELRADYRTPRVYARNRDFARKYAWSTFELLHHGLTQVSTAEMLEGESVVPPLLSQVCLDDFWQLLSEMRMELDQIDGDLSSDLRSHLLESLGTKTRQNLVWMRSTLREIYEWAKHMAATPPALSQSEGISAELGALVQDVILLQGRAESTSNMITSFTGLAQSSLVIDQTSGVNKLTELAFFFIPLSFVTAVFSMQVVEFSDSPPEMWVWGLSLTLVLLVSYLIRMTLRSPSLRLFARACRVTILNRFTSSQVRSSSRELNSISNIAIVKFMFFFFLVWGFVIGLICLLVAFIFFIFAGIWLGVAATALYFIITRWPDPAVLAPCFISLVLAAAGLWVSWYWNDEISNLIIEWAEKSVQWFKDVLPARWTMDKVDDEDLAKEGIKTYGRQAIMLASA